MPRVLWFFAVGFFAGTLGAAAVGVLTTTALVTRRAAVGIP